MNDNNRDRIKEYQDQAPEMQELIGALALAGLDDIHQMIDPSNHPSKTTKDESLNQ